jgi:hypothetical protein
MAEMDSGIEGIFIVFATYEGTNSVGRNQYNAEQLVLVHFFYGQVGLRKWATAVKKQTEGDLLFRRGS